MKTLIISLSMLLLASCAREAEDKAQASSPTPPGPLVITEYVAKGSTQENEFGKTSDWLEISNQSKQVISLGEGWFLTDDQSNQEKFMMPAIDLAPGEHLIVWCDKETAGNDVHANFKLSSEKDVVALYHRSPQKGDLQLVDWVSIEPHPPGQSLMLNRDSWEICSDPSPGNANYVSSSSLLSSNDPAG